LYLNQHKIDDAGPSGQAGLPAFVSLSGKGKPYP